MTLKSLYESAVKGELSEGVKRVLEKLGAKLDSYEEFLKSVREGLIEKYRLKAVVDRMVRGGIPWNKTALSQLLGVTEREALVVMRLAEGTGLVVPVKEPRIALSDEERVYFYIAGKGAATFKEISRRFQRAREIVLKLWKEGKVAIREYERAGIRPDMVGDFDRIPAEAANLFRGYVTLWASDDGVEYLKLEIPPRARITVRVVAEQGEG